MNPIMTPYLAREMMKSLVDQAAKVQRAGGEIPVNVEAILDQFEDLRRESGLLSQAQAAAHWKHVARCAFTLFGLLAKEIAEASPARRQSIDEIIAAYMVGSTGRKLS